MKTLLWISLICWPMLALAETAQKPTSVAEIGGGNKLFIFHEPCPLGPWFTKWQKGRWIFAGKPYDACWRIERDANDNIVIKTVDDNGDTGSVPAQIFKKLKAI